MARLPEVVPITELRQDATAIVDRASSAREPIVITQRGRPAAVMVGIEAYERTQHELELLRLLARGQREIEAGKGHDLDEVLAEAEAILEETQR